MTQSPAVERVRTHAALAITFTAVKCLEMLHHAKAA